MFRAQQFVTIVSGLPRSGTSMMMRMLEAGGMPVMADHLRQADEDNPRGYYEFEPAKQTGEDPSWLDDASGKVVKMVYRLLYDLPPDYTYRVVFMRRNIDEVLASQDKMLVRSGQDNGPMDDRQMAQLFAAELDKVLQWLAGQKHFSVREADYNQLLEDPRSYVKKINRFLGGKLDARAMGQVIDPTLYRNRKQAAATV